jgi:hypothetical protein
MLHEFVLSNHAELVTRVRALVARRSAPRALTLELEEGVPLFLQRLGESLRFPPEHRPPDDDLVRRRAATHHGGELLRQGFTIAQVVHDYGAACQAITELAVERDEPIAAEEFRDLNLHLDEAIADAVTEYLRVRETALAGEERERIGSFAHEMRNLTSMAMLSFELLQSGRVPANGSSAVTHGRALRRIQVLIDRTLSEVRLGASLVRSETIRLAELMEEIEVTAVVDARHRGLELIVAPVAWSVLVDADRQLLASAIGNLLQNAFKFTSPNSRVVLRAALAPGRPNIVRIEVEDECAGLPAGRIEDLFRPFERGPGDRSGVGLGLAISRKAVEASGGVLSARGLPVRGCVFTVELPVAAD